MKFLLIEKYPVLLRVFYYMPDYNSIIQEFNWQTVDSYPLYPRINRFLNYWRHNIDAVIADIEMSRI
jgi:uncharacterized protein Usg